MYSTYGGASLATGASHPLSNAKTTPTHKYPRKLSTPLAIPDGLEDGVPPSPEGGGGLHGNSMKPQTGKMGRLSGWGGRRRLGTRGVVVLVGCVVVLILFTTGSLHTFGTLPSSVSYPSLSTSLKKPLRSRITIPKGVHPIDILLRNAEAKWDKMVARQSKTLDQAVKEYKRRYGRKPPKGFDKWWEYAGKRKIVLVDEFDTIHHDLQPFWGLSASQIEDRRIELLEKAKSDRLLPLRIRNGEVSDEDGPASSKKWPHNKSYYQLFDQFSKDLPDMNVLLNVNDQPIGFVSWEEKQRLIQAGKKGVYAPDSEEIQVDPVLMAKTRGLAFEDLRAACPPGSPARVYTTDLLGETIYPLAESSAVDFRLPADQGGFVYDVAKQSDVCYNPALKDQHGNFLKPELHVSMQRNRLYPVFSWSRYKASSDISIPTNYRFQWGPPDLADWDKMQNKMAWRGTLTGMYPDNRAVFNAQRHRLMMIAQDDWKRHEILLKNETSGEYQADTIRSGVGNSLWLDVGIGERGWNRNNEMEKIVAKIITPSERMDNKQRSLFKILLDVDGWGWSARYRELLRSTSAVIKTTVFHEAFSDWLIPWYHYIPINYEYSDLYSVLLYFFGVEEAGQEAHDEALKAIADRGSEWSNSQLSWDQHTVYVYRLALEWARLTADDRSSMDY